jgi:hypothetical protein
MDRVEVDVVPNAMSSLAIRFERSDLSTLRKRAQSEGVGVTQLVRAWVLERLAEEGEVPLEADEALATLRRLVTQRGV